MVPPAHGAVKVPKTIIFGELPKTSTGKIQKNVLRDRVAQSDSHTPAGKRKQRFAGELTMTNNGGPYNLSGRAALVTGASSGLGRHFALTLAHSGAKVALAARRTGSLEEVRGAIAEAGGNATAVELDVTDAGRSGARSPRRRMPWAGWIS